MIFYIGTLFFFFCITPQHFFKTVWQVSCLLMTLRYLSSWLLKQDVAQETSEAEAGCQSRVHPAAISPSSSSLALALVCKKAKDWNLLFWSYSTSLLNIHAVPQGISSEGSATAACFWAPLGTGSWAGWLAWALPGHGLRGAMCRHTAELIIIFKMFQEPQKQIK